MPFKLKQRKRKKKYGFKRGNEVFNTKTDAKKAVG